MDPLDIVNFFQKNRPVSLSEDCLPSFPVDALPAALRGFVVACAESLQVPEDMTAVCGLAICSLAIQRKFKIMGKTGWEEPTNIYTALIAAPGERKSAVTSTMAAPIFTYEAEVNEQLQSLVDEYQIKHNILGKQVKGLEDSAAKATAKPGALERALAKQKELAELEEREPKLIRLWTDDATPEAITSLMAEHDGKIGVISAEGGLFDTLAGRYTNGVNIDVVLKAHAGDPVRVDRKGRPSEYIKNPAMTIFLAIQPQVLDGIMQNEAFRGRGLTARFLYAMPVSKVGARAFDTAPIPPAIVDAYESMVKRLLNIPQQAEERVIALSLDATEVLRAFYQELEPRLADDLEAIGDWAGKLMGAILRVAGVLHVIQHLDTAAYKSITPETLQDAIKIGKYFLEHSKAAYKLMGADKTMADAQFIIKKLAKRTTMTVNRRDLYRMCRPRFDNPDAMAAALALLEEYFYLAEVTTEYSGMGKPPAPKYFVNPALYGQNGQNGQ